MAALLVLSSYALLCLAPGYLVAWIWLGTGPWSRVWPVVLLMVMGGLVAGIAGVRLGRPRPADH